MTAEQDIFPTSCRLSATQIFFFNVSADSTNVQAPQRLICKRIMDLGTFYLLYLLTYPCSNCAMYDDEKHGFQLRLR